MSQQDSDMMRIEKAIEDRTQIERIHSFNQFKDMYEVARDFILKHDLILFGGYALNAIFPPEHKFYDAYELPDYDVFTPSAKAHADKLASIYRENGYQYIDVRHAMHVGSYKLIVEFRPVVDFHDTPKPLFDRFLKTAKAQRADILKINPAFEDLYIAPLDFLRFTVHNELSAPHGEVMRWSKVYSRFSMFYQLYPFAYNSKCTKDLMKPITDPLIKHVLKAALSYAEGHGLPHIGASAMAMLMQQDSSPDTVYKHWGTGVSSVELMSEAAKETTDELLVFMRDALKSHAEGARYKLSVKQYGKYGHDDHNVPCHIVFLQETGKTSKQALVTIHQTVSCHSTVKLGQTKLGNLDTVIRFLFHYIFVPISKESDEVRKCMISMMYNIMFNSDTDKQKNKLLTRFVLDCYGYQPSLNTAKRQRAARVKRV